MRYHTDVAVRAPVVPKRARAVEMGDNDVTMFYQISLGGRALDIAV